MDGTLTPRPQSAVPSRVGGLDFVRCVAVFFVLSVHFFMNGGFYDTPLIGGKLLLATAVRWLFFSCVPLFILLTGFLQNRKKAGKAYYRKILRILFEYLVICVICNLFRILYLGETLSLTNWIGSILKFSAAPYAWYVNFYIGLFLLIPFLNLIYNGLTTQKGKQLLLGTLLLLTALPAAVNGVLPIFPDWWTRIYPLCYYFIGCYLAEYRPRVNRFLCVAGVGIIALLEAIFSFWYAKGGVFSSTVPFDYGALPTVALSVLLFLALYDVHLGKLSGKVAAHISDWALSIYLISWVFDKLFYPPLISAVPLFSDRLPFYFVVVPLVFLCSACCSSVVCWARNRTLRAFE
ncbi:MAG: acyltransferase [Oscillospiraceae bacterium]